MSDTKKPSIQIEICANSYPSAVAAQKGGANRIELCANLQAGGTTPSAGTIQLCTQQLSLEVFVLIRPRVGDFCYTDEEFYCMKADIAFAKSAGVHGIVSGILNTDGTIDVLRTKELMALSAPLPFTFHRAFDKCPDAMAAYDTLREMGVHRLLTSGQAPTALAGKELLKSLVERSRNGGPIVMPGAGINAQNISELAEYTQATEFHFSAKSLIRSNNKALDTAVSFGGSMEVPENNYYQTDDDLVKRVMKTLKNEI